jgi:hypothetical protein
VPPSGPSLRETSTNLPLESLDTQVTRAGPESELEEAVDTSGRSRRKRAPRDIGALNGCLCGCVVNLDVALDRPAIECRQPGCETRWVCSILTQL